MSGKSDDGAKGGGGNPLARKLLAKIGEKAKAAAPAEAAAKAAAPASAGPKAGTSKAAPVPEGALGALVSALKTASPNFGKEEDRPRKKPEGYDNLKAARGGRGIGPGANAAQSKAVQAALIAAGVKVAETGAYDDATEEAVRGFQRAQGLESRSGKVDAATLDALDKALGLVPSSRGNIAVAGPTGGTDEDADDAGGPSGGAREVSSEDGPSRRVNVTGGLTSGFAGGKGLGMGVDVGGFVGGGRKSKGGKGQESDAPSKAPLRSDQVSSYTPPSDDDLAESAEAEALLAKGAGPAPLDGRPKSFPRSENEFVDRIAWPAVRAMWETGVPASALIAMAVLEGAWGDRPLAKEAKNLYGLEGEGTQGSLPLTAAEAGYAASMSEAGQAKGGGRGEGKRRAWRRYASFEESIFDMARHMATDAAYEEALTAKGAPERLLRALTEVHTRIPHFGETCVRVFDQQRLGVYDSVRSQ